MGGRKGVEKVVCEEQDSHRVKEREREYVKN